MAQVEGGEEDAIWAFKCGDGRKVKFSADKLVEYSGYFSALMRSEMRETKDKTLDLRLFTADSMTLLLKMFRLKDLKLCDTEVTEIFQESLDTEIVEDVLKVIDYLDMPCLYPRCSDLLKILLPSFCHEIDNVWRMWEVCQFYGLESVEKGMFKQIAQNISVIERSDYFFFREVPGDVLSGVLAVPDMNISSEIAIMRFIVDWIQYFQEERISYFDSLFRCIHIPSLTHSELTDIDSMLKELGLSHINVWQMFTNYMSNPHKFFLLRPELSEIRNGKEVLMLFGGVYDPSVMSHRQQPGGRRRRHHGPVPLLYQDLDEVQLQCLNENYENSVEMILACNSPRTKGPTSKDSGLLLKPMNKLQSRLKSPVRLVEFGICLHENFVYLAGGQRNRNDDAKYAVKGAYELDPHIGEWSEIAHMKEARCLFCLCNIWGRLYAVGGANRFGILECTEYYIPEEDQWFMGPSLNTKLHEHAGCVFKDKLYISGGHDSTEHTDKAWVLDTKEGSWNGVAPLLEARSYHAMVAIDDKMYVVGGCRKIGDTIKDLFSVEEYDPTSDTWTHLLNLNVPISSCNPVVIDNEVLFVGGYSFDQGEYLQQAVSLHLKKRRWKFSPVEINLAKKVVGYMCLKLKVQQRILR